MFTQDDFNRFGRAFEADFKRLHDELGGLFQGVIDPRRLGQPMVNLWSGDEGAMLTAEVPGAGPGDVEVSVLVDEVIVSGTWSVVDPGEDEHYQLQERREGDFKRAIKLPFEVDPDGVKAKVENGLLTVELPRKVDQRPRKVTVSVE